MEDQEVVSAEAAEDRAETPVEEVVEQEEVVTPEVVAGEVVPSEPKKKTAQERIDEITKARREAEREREYWKKVALEKETKNVEPEPVRSNIPQRPTLDQFDTTMEYEDALFSWYESKKEIETRVSKQQVEQDEALQTFNQRAKKFRAEHEDFDEVIESPVFSPIMRAALLHSENGPAVAYHLGQNTELAAKIRKLPLEMQPYEIGKLESQLLIAQKTKKVPSAPAPITPVGISGGSPELDTSKMTTAEWMAWDKQRTLDKLKAKLG